MVNKKQCYKCKKRGTMVKETFDKNYFENGVATGVSGYTNYHWRPEYVLPLANELKRRYLWMGGDVLDFGCAKGYLVKAFKLLGVHAYGYDISKYAIKTGDSSVDFLIMNKRPSPKAWEFNLIVAKDVLEHIPREKLPETLQYFDSVLSEGGKVFVVVPLGDDGFFRIREFELDKTHVIKEDEEWWIKQFNKAGFVCDEFYYSFPGAKNHWEKVHPYGNGVFILRKEVN